MVAPSIAYSTSREEWVVLGTRRESAVQGELVLLREELEKLRAVDLRKALQVEANNYEPASGKALVAAVPAGYLEEEGPYDPVSFEWDGRALTICASHLVEWSTGDDEEKIVARIRALVEPLLASSRSTLVDVEDDQFRWNARDLRVDIRIEPVVRGRSVADLFAIGEGVLRLCDAFDHGAVTRDTVAHLVRGGGASLLTGQPESNWLDVKSQEYDLSTTGGKISLAQAVARFCNGEDGGLIVIGAHARKVPGGEIITKVPGLPIAAGAPARYLRILNNHLYPPPFGLRVEVVEVSENRALIIIDIPPQQEESKPFLVSGAIRTDGKTEGVFISIVRRRGEESIALTAPMIHATLAAGRALLRGEGGRPEGHNLE